MVQSMWGRDGFVVRATLNLHPFVLTKPSAVLQSGNPYKM